MLQQSAVSRYAASVIQGDQLSAMPRQRRWLHAMRGVMTAMFIVLLLMASTAFAAQRDAPSAEKSSDKAAVKPTDKQPEKKGWFDEILDSFGADDTFDPSKGMNWVFLPGPFFSPDAKFGVGISTVGLYRLDPKDTQTQLSTLEIDGFLTTNKSVGIAIDNKMFFPYDKYRLYTTAIFYDAPELYYGVGYEQNIQSSNRQDYTKQQIDFNVQALFRIVTDTYLGAGIDYDKTKARRIRPEASAPVTSFDFPNKNQSVGILASLVHDSRDVVINPEKGRLVQFTANYYTTYLGSDTDFSSYLIDYREYMSLKPLPGLLAFQIKANLSAGDVPWSQLSTLGGDSALRGYIIGRYRDRQTVLSQLEYRVPIAGRHGMVTWIGGAALADRISEFSAQMLLPNIGVGYRLRLKGRVNLRLDFGVGRNGGGFYFNVDEAF